MNVKFDTRPYRYDHGKEPRGSGWWGFSCRGNSYWFIGSYSFAKDMCKHRVIDDFAGSDHVTVAVLACERSDTK